MELARTSHRLTRIAPTPSGYLHLGNVLSFALTATLAKHSGARILLRIDDLDRERVKPEYVQDVFDTLRYLNIPWDEGPRNYHEYETRYSQTWRMHRYGEALQRLRANGWVFACRCSRADVWGRNSRGVYDGTCRDAELSLDEEGLNWRLDVAGGAEAPFREWSGRTLREALPDTMHYYVVRKRDGFPAYQLASLVDDEDFGVDLIVRGADLWDSTLAQHVLAGRLGLQTFPRATFVHHELLMTAKNEKFSKSAGDTSIQYLRKHGKTKESIFNEIGPMVGLAEPVSDWEQLGNALMRRGGFTTALG